MGSIRFATTETSDIALVLTNHFLDIQANVECGCILKRIRDLIKTYNHTTQLNHLVSLTKWLSVCLQTKWLSACALLQSFNLQISRPF